MKFIGLILFCIVINIVINWVRERYQTKKAFEKYNNRKIKYKDIK